jgi:hypothetical protein
MITGNLNRWKYIDVTYAISIVFKHEPKVSGYMNRVSKIFPDHKRSFEWTLYCYWDQTKLIQFWNVILDVHQSRYKNFIKRIISVNRASQALYDQPLYD